ncbi:MAG: radical SAM protein [Bacteroidetes bacterium]|nr:radical SAM protein [Bacteroidota bacterium]
MKPIVKDNNIHHNVLHPTIIWDTTKYCNYKCIYCYCTYMPNRLIENPIKFSIDHISNSFKHFLPNWVINYIGGEPFLLKNFIELNQKITENNYIALYTNLSLDNQIYSFAQKISPERVTFINCALHVAERTKTDPKFDRFINLYKTLQTNSFPVFVTYIVHPTLKDRIIDDINFFAEKGIKIYLKVFRGAFENKSYPESYDKNLISIIEKYEPQIIRGSSIRTQITGESKLCRAGLIFLEMDSKGNVYRCLTERSQRRNRLGNLFDNTLDIHKRPEICTLDNCNNARQGMAHLFGSSSNFFNPSIENYEKCIINPTIAESNL